MTERLINVCKTIECPYADSSFDGCKYYPVAIACHLIYSEGSQREELYNQSTQYYLYQFPSKVDLDKLKSENEEFLNTPEVVRDLAFRAKRKIANRRSN